MVAGLNFLCRHGIFQLQTPWADGAAYVTQCPIRPGQSYTYRFNVTGQEGTLWWHAHLGFHRATVFGALIIRPKHGRSAYPFAKPHKEIPILLGMLMEVPHNSIFSHKNLMFVHLTFYHTG